MKILSFFAEKTRKFGSVDCPVHASLPVCLVNSTQAHSNLLAEILIQCYSASYHETNMETNACLHICPLLCAPLLFSCTMRSGKMRHRSMTDRAGEERQMMELYIIRYHGKEIRIRIAQLNFAMCRNNTI